LNRLKIGLVGCGAIGTELARSIETRFFKKASLEAMCEKNPDRAQELASCLKYIPQLTTLEELVDRVDLVIEAASIDVVPEILALAVKKGKDVLILSVGGAFWLGWRFKKGRRKRDKNLYPFWSDRRDGCR